VNRREFITLLGGATAGVADRGDMSLRIRVTNVLEGLSAAGE
jgi:hypothetical protein